MSELITIGIPFFNNEKTLREAVLSTLKQTYTNLEIILIDDGSSDSSLTIAKLFTHDPRVKVISDGKNLGLIKRLNQIISIAQGEFIARMDADDLMDTQRIEKQINYFKQHPQTDVVTTGMVSLDNELNPLGKRCCAQETPNVYEVFKNGEGILHASMMAKTSWWKNNQYRENFDRAEDRELFTRTIGKCKYHVITEPLYFYRDVQNMTLQKYLKSYESERKAVQKNWKGKITLPQTFYLILRSLIKSVVIRAYFLLGIQESLFKSKNQLLDLKECAEIKEKIQVLIR